MICPNCNETEHEPGAKFCHMCGYRFQNSNNFGRVKEIAKPLSKEWRVIEAIAIDLGLPSGTKWAPCNVGATEIYECGGYYAWGETSQKDVYDWNSYIHCDGSDNSCHNLGSNICLSKFDVAHIKWGGKWQMPAYEQFKELVDFCTYEWTNLYGIPGGKFTGPNGKSIFFPAAGLRYNSSFGCRENDGRYWSGTIGRDFPETACALNFNSDGADCSSGWGGIWSNRYLGQSVRPVLNP